MRLLDKTVRDRVTTQKAMVTGYDEATDQYRIEFLPEEEDHQPEFGEVRFEPGHSTWRKVAQLLVMTTNESREYVERGFPRRPGGTVDPNKGRQKLIWDKTAGRMIVVDL